MTNITLADEVKHSLSKNKKKEQLFALLQAFRSHSGELSKKQLAILLGQWYYPLHYFPVFLSRVISLTPSLEMQTYASRILWQELGEGDPANSHEKLYIDTFLNVGFEQDDIDSTTALEGTEKLLAGYRESSRSYLDGLGFLYGTEVVDLAMVNTVRSLVSEMTGSRELPWVDVHVRQEPDHVASSGRALNLAMTIEEQEQLSRSAENCWTLWLGFYDSLKPEMFSEPLAMKSAAGDGASPADSRSLPLVPAFVVDR